MMNFVDVSILCIFPIFSEYFKKVILIAGDLNMKNVFTFYVKIINFKDVCVLCIFPIFF